MTLTEPARLICGKRLWCYWYCFVIALLLHSLKECFLSRRRLLKHSQLVQWVVADWYSYSYCIVRCCFHLLQALLLSSRRCLRQNLQDRLVGLNWMGNFIERGIVHFAIMTAVNWDYQQVLSCYLIIYPVQPLLYTFPKEQVKRVKTSSSRAKEKCYTFKIESIVYLSFTVNC